MGPALAQRGRRLAALGRVASLCVLFGLAFAAVPGPSATRGDAGHDAAAGVRVLSFSYRAHLGAVRKAYLVLPAWYGPKRHPALPIVVSPHGRGVDGAYNLRFWGNLPARGPFAVVSPDGQGRRLAFYSWGTRARSTT